jgi:hypothetical protein
MINGTGGSINPDTNIPLWSDATAITGTTPSTAVSARISCSMSIYYPGTATTYDQIYFNTGSGAF